MGVTKYTFGARLQLPSTARATDLAHVPHDPVITLRPTREALPQSVRGTRRAALLLCGTLSLGLGLLGIFIPLLPTTCFLLLAAWCYARSSQRLYDRLMTARLIGPYLQRYRDTRVIPPRVKIAALVMMWITIGYAVLTYPNLAVRLTLLAIAIGVTLHLQKLPSPSPSAAADARRLAKRQGAADPFRD